MKSMLLQLRCGAARRAHLQSQIMFNSPIKWNRCAFNLELHVNHLR